MLRICQKLKLSSVHVNARNSHAPTAAIWPIVTRFSYANCMTLVTWPTIGRLICWSLTHSTAVQSARNISMPILPTWQTQVATIPAELSTWRCGWSWKTGYHIGRHHGIYGETIGFLFPGLRFKTGLKQRGKKAEQRVTTEYLNGVPHQVCQFHVLKEINREILKALTQVRHRLKKKLPKLKRGRPSSQAARKAARRKKKLQRKISDLFEHRHLFVKHSLTPRDRKIFLSLTRGLYNLRNLRSA